MIVIRLPIPPSVNALYANRKDGRGKGRYKTKAYADWLNEANSWLWPQYRKLDGLPVKGPCVVEIRLPAKMRGDASNRIKAAEDFLVSMGITEDDRTNWKVSAERDPSLSNDDGFCVITVASA